VTVSRTVRCAALLAALALLGACTNREHPIPVASPSSQSPTPSPTTASPTPTPGLVSPLTGLPVATLAPMVAVKVDNAPLARPQWGLDKADVVYEEMVEGRTTRFLAVFSSQPAPEVGPVRSVRESDVDLLAQYGKLAFAFSGGNTGVLATVRRAPLYIVSRDTATDAYVTRGRRKDAFNFVASTAKLLAHAVNAVTAHDVGLRFGVLSRRYKRLGTTASVLWGHAHTQWTWDPTHGYYYRSMDGRRSVLRDGAPMTSPNVLVQYCAVRGSRYSDIHGVPSPFTTTTGTGKAVLLRDGHVIVGTWKRIGLGATHYYDLDGRDLLLHPGPVWIMLVPRNNQAAIH
jgi:hypothetical protein